MGISNAEYERATKAGAETLKRGPVVVFVAYLAEIEIEAQGLSLHWPKLDADVWVPSLVEGVTGTRAWIATRGGATKSEAKAATARGRRPKKIEA